MGTAAGHGKPSPHTMTPCCIVIVSLWRCAFWLTDGLDGVLLGCLVVELVGWLIGGLVGGSVGWSLGG